MRLSLLALALGLSLSAHAQGTDTATRAQTTDIANAQNAQNDGDGAVQQPASRKAVRLEAVDVHGRAIDTYAGGDIARRGSLGVLGEQDLMDAPFSMTSYTEAYIARRQAYTIADVVADDPAVRVGDGYGNFAETFVLRGFPLNGDDITYDGLYGIIPRQLVDADAIGRLDVLRGASAFLYGVSPGGSGIGGSINVEPKWATDAPLTRVGVDYGSEGQGGAQFDFSRRFGADNRYGIRVNLGGRSGNTAVDRESRRSNFQSISFDYRGDRFRIEANLSHQLQRIDDGRSVVYLSGDGLPKPPPASANYAQPWSYSSLEDTYGVVRAEYDFLPDLTGYVAVGADHSNERGDYWNPSVDRYGVGTAYRLGVPYQNDAQTGEAGLRLHLDTGPVSQKINLGVSALNQKKTVSYIFSATSPVNLYDYAAVPYPATSLDGGKPVVTGRVKLKSLALSDTLGFADDNVLLTLGARRQEMHVLGYDYAVSGHGKNADYRKSATSPVMGLVVKLGPQFSLFANSIQGLSQGPQAPDTAANAGQVFKPYRSRQLEAGVKYDAGSFGSTFSLFQIKQPTGILNGATNVFSVVGEQRNRGAEWSLYGEPLAGLKLTGGASYIDAKLSRTAGGANSGNIAVGVPKWQYNASADWAVPGAPGLDLDLAVTRTGGQYVDVANTLRIHPWTRVDLGASYATMLERHPVTFRLGIFNVANSNYWASSLGGYLTEGAPRLVKLSVTMDF